MGGKKMAKLKIKKGDNVVVITGKDKGVQGEILVAMPSENKVIVKEVNVVSKHRKPRSQTDVGGIIKQEAPIDASNVMLVCPKCKAATRVGYQITDGKKVRVCKKCGAVID
jgi:large subunit ribosomal protein L24